MPARSPRRRSPRRRPPANGPSSRTAAAGTPGGGRRPGDRSSHDRRTGPAAKPGTTPHGFPNGVESVRVGWPAQPAILPQLFSRHCVVRRDGVRLGNWVLPGERTCRLLQSIRPTRAWRPFDASVDPTEACKPAPSPIRSCCKRSAEPSLARMAASIPELHVSSPGERSWSDSNPRQGDGHGANGGAA